jgi:ParB family transcriptional regulator, chromosome partitioning protein
MHATPKRGLGRGFEALLPTNFDKKLVLNDDERIQKLQLDEVVPNPDQPRRHFDETTLAELAASIKQYGVLLPLVVTPHGQKYQIVAGERRWRAAKLAGLKQVPAVIRSLKDLERLEVALVENVQRVDLSPLEQAASLLRLHEQFSIAFDTIAKRLGKAPSTLNNMVRLLKLPPAAQEALTNHAITEGHARSILALKDNPAQQEQLLLAIQRHGWSVRQAERYVTSLKEGVQEITQVRARVQTETPATKSLSKKLGTAVHIKRMAHGGRLEINFKSDDELDQIISRLH